MGILNIFSGKNPEDYESKGDKFTETGVYGKAILEYERALERLEKSAPWDDGFRQSLRDKIHNSKAALVLQHQKTAADLIEAGYPEDALQYIQLALELTEDPDTIGDLENQKRELEARALQGVPIEEPEIEIADPKESLGDEPVGGDPDDENFTALVGTLPEEIQKAYLDYGEAFKKGYYEVQDASSQLVAELLDEKPGQRVVDTCAGAGGKSLHLAALMENKGQLIAMDIYGSKLKELKRRARRNGAHNIEPREITSTKVFKKLYGSADRVLIDAPCTGLGVLRRNPDSKWKMQPEFLEKITKTQHEIIRSYSKIVKSGGKMVYATCSILPQENNDQIKSFLSSEEGKDFSVVKEKKIYASKSGFDGFYMALLEKA